MNREEFLREELDKKSARRDRIGVHLDTLTSNQEQYYAKLQEIERDVEDPGLLTFLYCRYLRKKCAHCRSEIVEYDIEFSALDCECGNLAQKLLEICKEKSESEELASADDQTACESACMEQGQ